MEPERLEGCWEVRAQRGADLCFGGGEERASRQPSPLVLKPPILSPLGSQWWTPCGAEESAAWPPPHSEKQSEAVGREGAMG